MQDERARPKGNQMEFNCCRRQESFIVRVAMEWKRSWAVSAGRGNIELSMVLETLLVLEQGS